MFVSRWTLGIFFGVALSGYLDVAWAQGNVTFRSDTPAVVQEAPSVSSAVHALGRGRSKQGLSVSPYTAPGINRAILPPVTPEDSEQAIQSRPIAPEINLPDIIIVPSAPSGAKTDPATMGVTMAATTGPASIAELARALKNNPDLIYEYVRNNIEYYPVWGVQKGAVGSILDNQGTAFDQAALMISLLRQAGYTASFVKGRINLTAAQVNEWLGVETNNVCAVLNLLGQGQVPVASITATADCSCPNTGAPVALVSMKIDHVWVKANIGGINYFFDPSYKPHTLKAGIDLVAATGYSASGYLTAAKTGAAVTANFVQGINRTNIRTNLTTYATKLTNYLRSNKPAAALEDVIGGMTINPHPGGNLRQTVLPYQDTTVALTEWAADIPAYYRPTLRIKYQGINMVYTSDAIYGKRLTITYNASNQPVLKLDGVLQATGTAITPGTNANVTFSVTHGAYADTGADQSFTQAIKAGGTFLIGNGWGPAGRGLVELHRIRLDEAKATGSADTSEVILGSTLAVLSATWIAQVNQADYINDRLAKTNTLFHHQIGIAGYNTAAYVDLPGNMLSVVSQSADTNKESAAFFSAAMHSSIFESTAVQQITGVSAVSTVKLVDIAATNNDRIYDAKSANYTSAVQPNLVSCASWLPTFQAAVNAGHRLILPTRCTITEASWSGTGYFDISGDGMGIGSIIGGGLAGGFSSAIQPATQTVANSLSASISSNLLTQTSGSAFGEPIDMANGSYLYDHNDITAGVGAFPMSLNFERLYSSGRRTQDGPMGRGWTHNLNASATVGSDGFQGLGEDSALDAAASIIEKMVAIDLLSDAAKPLDKMVIATLGQRWYGDQLINNTVIVRQGLNGEVFVKLLDGTHNAPPGNAAKLSKNTDTTYTYETLNRAKLNFNVAGKIASYVHPSGVQVNFTYSGNDLTTVANSLGRSLTLTNTTGRVTQVADGARNVKYLYDVNANLTTFTDATAKSTTFQYDLPGRLSKFFYPSNPTIAFITNVYDTLGRVQTQTNANAKLYTYYFAGSRSEEVAPGNISRVSYLNALGKVVKAVNPLGKVTTNTYDGQSRLVSTVLPEGNKITYTYDDAPCAAQKRCTHNLKTVSQVPKAGSGLPTLTSSSTYESSFNQVASVTDPRAKLTTYTYTAQGNPLTVTYPADAGGVQPSTTYAYSSYTPTGFPSFSLQSSATNKTSASNSVVTATTYNPANKYVPLTTVVDSGTGKLNLTTSYTYDGFGNLTQVNGPRADVTDTVSYAYDAERRLTQSTDALGKISKQAYDADGRIVRSAAQIGSQWLVSCRSYSYSGKLLKSWGPGQTALDTTCPTAAAPVAVTGYAYDNLDRLLRVTESLTATEGGNRVSETVYNANDSVLSVKRAVGNALAQTYAAYTYTNNGLPATVKDAKNNLTTYQYDGHDRKLKTLFPDKVIANTSSATDYEQYGYDNNSNLVTLRKRNGQTVTLAYDNLNRLLSRSYPTTEDNVTFSYDLLGRRLAANYANASYNVSYAWDNAGRLTNTVAGGKTLAYQYDPAGNRTRTTWPEATPFYVTTTYDALNRPTAIKELGVTSLATYTYDDLSRRSTVTRGNASTTTSYGYTTQSALASLGHNLTGTGQDITHTYTRNQVGEIASQSWNNNIYQWNGALNASTNYTANGLNQYTQAGAATLGYDGNGNLAGDGMWTYGYDTDNRLKSATKIGLTATLAYDAVGRMRQTTLGGVVTNLLYDGADLVAEYNSAGMLLRRYVHGPGIDEPLAWYEGSGATSKSWLYADHLGSIIATANSAGTSTATYSYGPYGEPNLPTGLRFRYTGQQLIGQLGLYYYKARFYSPSLGRFLQTDPIGYTDDLNLYAYVQNNPVNRIDPTGLDWLYQQSTGQLSYQPPDAAGGGPPQLIATGYSGHGVGLNNPAMQDVRDTGPIPQGTYTIGPQQTNVTSNHTVLPGSMRLASQPGTDTLGRSGFLIHGGNFTTMNSSRGCIVLQSSIRNQIGNSGDTTLRVNK